MRTDSKTERTYWQIIRTDCKTKRADRKTESTDYKTKSMDYKTESMDFPFEIFLWSSIVSPMKLFKTRPSDFCQSGGNLSLVHKQDVDISSLLDVHTHGESTPKNQQRNHLTPTINALGYIYNM